MASLVTSFPVCYMGCMSGFMAAWVEFGRLAPRHVWKDKPLGDDAEAIKTYNDQYVPQVVARHNMTTA